MHNNKKTYYTQHSGKYRIRFWALSFHTLMIPWFPTMVIMTYLSLASNWVVGYHYGIDGMTCRALPVHPSSWICSKSLKTSCHVTLWLWKKLLVCSAECNDNETSVFKYRIYAIPSCEITILSRSCSMCRSTCRDLLVKRALLLIYQGFHFMH